jgi:PAS domain S-box-containing protein
MLDTESSYNLAAEPLRLLFLDAGLNAARTQVQQLRESGWVIESRVLAEPSELHGVLKRALPDLVVYHYATEVDLKQLAWLRETYSELVLVLVIDSQDSITAEAALTLGIQALVVQGNSAMLKLVLGRELKLRNRKRQVQRLKQQLAEALERYQGLIEHSQEAIAYLYEGIHLRVNPSYLALFGLLDLSDLDGMTLLDFVAPKDHAALKRLLRKISDNNASGQIRLHFLGESKREFEALVNFSPAVINGERCTQVNLVDLSAAKALDLKVSQVSVQDQDTGLSSQRVFIAQFNELMPSIQQGRQGSLLYISLNGINTFRDAKGDPAVQQFFSDTSEIIKTAEADIALISRLSEHSFAILSFRHDPGAIAALCEQLCRAIGQRCEQLDLAVDLRPSCNIGLRYVDSQSQSAESLLQQAAEAAETAFVKGRNLWQTYGEIPEDPKVLADIQQREAMLATLNTALEENHFRLFYQPLISLKGDSREHYSVLVRMLNKDNISFLPQAFFDCAKEHGRMAAIDRWVIQHAIEALAQERKNQRRLNLFIQLAAESLKDEDLLLWVCDCLSQYDAKGSWITFQITDHDVRTNATKARTLIKGLKRISSRICISHFGLSPKSHTLLEQLPLDYIKLAPTITQGLNQNQNLEYSLIKALELARAHQVQVIFGELEKDEHLSRLWQLGIHYLQGYLLQAPATGLGDEFELANLE